LRCRIKHILRQAAAAIRMLAGGTGMSEPRVVKKYPNRRLYDTVESRYITLADIRRLVVEQIDFLVIDKKSQADITRSILLQVIAEQEHGNQPMMSREFLSQVIRSYGTPVQSGMSGYLEQSVRQFKPADGVAVR
jgi:polyhydroxyalkanoate synthesis repressor PhaR